jgi:uncharacterized protein YggE
MFKSLLATVTAALLILTPALAEESKVNRMISISGTWRSDAPCPTSPPIIPWRDDQLRTTAQEALAANTKAMSDLLARAEAAGRGRNVTSATSNFNVLAAL